MIRTQLLLPYSLIFILLGRCIVAALVDKLFGAAQAAPKINEPQYSALCVVAKNENKYLREWLEYHRCLGVGRVYVYDHNSSVPLGQGVEDLVEAGFVQVMPITGTHVKYNEGFTSDLDRFMTTIQGQAYMDCIQRFSATHTFIGFIDVDEFVVLHDESLTSINDFLKRYEDYAGVSLYWELFGSSGHEAPPPAWVIASYQRCLPFNHRYNTQFKSFVNTAFRPTMYSPHRAMFEVAGPTSFLVDENKRRIAQGRNKNCTHAVAAVYHYATKSRADFAAKRKRGGGAGVTRPANYQKKLDSECNQTCTAALDTYMRACAARGLPSRAVLLAGGHQHVAHDVHKAISQGVSAVGQAIQQGHQQMMAGNAQGSNSSQPGLAVRRRRLRPRAHRRPGNIAHALADAVAQGAEATGQAAQALAHHNSQQQHQPEQPQPQLLTSD